MFHRSSSVRRLHLSTSALWRCALVALMTLTFVLSSYSLLVPQAHAASPVVVKKKPLPPPHPPTSLPKSAYTLTPRVSHQKALRPSPNVTSSVPFDGVGQLPFYTYITHPLTSTSCTCGKKELLVNVANGNLILHSVEMQIHGTAGLDLDIEAYYNSLASYSRDLGQNWVLSLGHDVYLDLSNPSVGITYHGPSGYAAYFAYNSGLGQYTDAPGLNATLFRNGDGSSTLSFHRTGAVFVFASSGHLFAVKDKNGNAISLSLDSDNDVNSITDTHSRAITFTHNTVFGTGHSPEGQVTKFSDPTGRTASYGYTNNQLTSETDLNGKTTLYQYTGSDLVQITDAMNNVTKIGYNTSHQVTSITDPKTGVMTFTYNSGNTVVNDQRQHNTTYNYEPMGKVISVVNDNGGTIGNMTYSNNYDMLTSQDALSNTTTATYSSDGYNNLTSTTDANGVTASSSYPTNGVQPYYPTGSKDSQGNSSAYVYDTSGNVKSSTNTSASPTVATSQTYNSDGTVHTSTDANGYVTTYGYTNGDLTTMTPPSPQHSETLSYDALSWVSTVTDGNGNQTTYTYTMLDRVATTSYKNASGGDTSSLTYTYDDDGNVLSVADSTAGTTSFTYDTLNRQTKKTLPDTTSVTYFYDATNNLTELSDVGGAILYTYNNLNQLSIIQEPDAAYGNGVGVIDKYYDANGRVTSIRYNNDVTQSYGYDKGGRVTSVSTSSAIGSLDNYTYSYTIGSTYTTLRASVTATLGSSTWTTNYAYDHLNRVTGATTTGAYPMTSSYSYDANGNRLSGSTTGTGASTPYSYTYQYDTANQLKQVNSSTCTNDGNGNQTGCGTSYKETYNARNQTTSMSTPNGSLTHQYVGADSTQRVQTTGTRAATYTYNALGLGLEKDSSGNLVAYTRDNQGNLLSMRTASGDYFYLFDALGSIVGVVDESDHLANTYLYDPYGVTEHQTGTQYNPWQFAGGYFDASTLYYKYGTRYYDRFGRWTQKDPQPSANPYLYANDDPVNLVDPSGRDTINCVTALVSNFILTGFFGTIGGLVVLNQISTFLISLVFIGVVSLGGALVILIGLGLLLVVGELTYFINVARTNCF